MVSLVAGSEKTSVRELESGLLLMQVIIQRLDRDRGFIRLGKSSGSDITMITIFRIGWLMMSLFVGLEKTSV